MSNIKNSDVVKNQYKSDVNLSKRISIHEAYSVNKMGFWNWIVSNYEFSKGMRILELGCGSGAIWKNHLHEIAEISQLVLTDFSSGMLQSAKAMLGEQKQITYNLKYSWETKKPHKTLLLKVLCDL